jgi:ribosome-associated protein
MTKPALVVNQRISIPFTELDFTFARSSGPGGQNVNKVNTKVTMHWDVNGSTSVPDDLRERFRRRFHRRVSKEGRLVIHSQRYRDQGRNVADCIAKLRDLLLEVASPRKPRKKTRPSRAAKERRLREKKARSQVKQLRRPPRDD